MSAARRLSGHPQHPLKSAADVRFAPGTDVFSLAIVTQAEIDQIEFGDEGQRWQVMDAQDFIQRQDAVPHMQERLARHWNVNSASTTP